MTQLVDTSTHMANFSRLEEAVGLTPPWLDSLRKAGMDRFNQVGFPSRKLEEWRNTDVSAIARTPFQLAEAGVSARAADLARKFSFGKDAACELVFVNGCFARELSRLNPLANSVRVDTLMTGAAASP